MHPQSSPVPPGEGGARPALDETTHRIVVVDRGWRIESIHPEVLTLLGNTDRKHPDLIGQTFWEGFPALVGTAAEKRLRAAMQHHAADDFELHYPISGTWTEVRARPHWPALSIYLRDISAVKQPAGTGGRPPRSGTEKPSLVDAAAPPLANLVCAFDREGRLTHASEALLERWGVRLPLARGRTMLEFNYPPLVAERLHRQIQRVISTGQPIKDDVAHLIREGRTEAHEHVFSPLMGHDGTVHGVAGAVRIIAERQVAITAPVAPALDGNVQRAKVLGEVAAEFFTADHSRVPLATLFERIAAAVGADAYLQHRLRDPSGPLLLENSSGIAHELLTHFAEFAVGKGLPGRVVQQRQPIILENLQSNQEPATVTLRKLGVQACACHLLKSGERLIGTLLLATRSQPRFVEDELRFIQAAAALVSARLCGDVPAPPPAEPEPEAISAVRSAVLKEDFLSSVVQELRVPLESTLQQVRTIADHPGVPPEIREELDAIVRNLTTETRLVSDLLDLSKITRGELSIEQSLLNLHGLFRDALASVRPDLAANGIVLAMNLPEVAPQIRGDLVRLQQVFWNLLKRAIKATPRGGVVSVQLSLTPENTVAVSITDTGVALTPEEAARVFEPWSAAPTGDAVGNQLGFGMATVRKIVELHGGKVQAAHPESGRGTRFVVELPLASEPAPVQSTTMNSAPPPTRPRVPAGQSPRILLVEDHPPTRDALLVLLRRRSHDVIVATSVREARGLAGQHRFDLVLSAVNLPDGSGYELMAALRLDHGLSGIALVGNGTEHDLALARTAGFVARLTKPVSIDALEKVLAAHVPA